MPTRRFTVREELRRSAGLDRPEVLCVRGRLQSDLNFVPIRCYSTTRVRAWPDGGRAHLELLDDDGDVVNKGPVALVAPVDHEGRTPYDKLTGYVAIRTGAAAVRLIVDGVEAWRRPLLEPAELSVKLGRVTRAGKVSVAIEHSRAHDGAHLGVVLSWGPRKFRTIGVYEPTKRLDLDLGEFPGSSESNLIVHYSNGQRSATAATDSFELDALEPQIAIEDPAAGARRSPLAPIDLTVNVVDPQHPKVVDDHITWLLDGEVVGHGRVLTADGLDVGDRDVEVRYDPPDDRKAVADACTVRVGRLRRSHAVPGCMWDD